MIKNVAFTLPLHPLDLLKTEQQTKNMRKSHLLQTNISNPQKSGIEEKSAFYGGKCKVVALELRHSKSFTVNTVFSRE